MEVIKTLTTPHGVKAGGRFNELHQEVQHHQGAWGHSLDIPPCSDKSQNLGFLRKSIFWFWGVPKNFFDPLRPYFALKNSLLGGHTSKTF